MFKRFKLQRSNLEPQNAYWVRSQKIIFKHYRPGQLQPGLVSAIASNYPENEYFLYTPRIESSPRVNFLENQKNIISITPRSKLFTSAWRSKFVINNLKRDGIAIYHGLSQELPIGIRQSGIKSIVTIHDLIYKRFPKYFGLISRNIYAAKAKYACANADKVIAISEQTKADLIEFLKVDPAKIEVIYQGCNAIFKVKQTAQKKTEVKLRYGLPENFILYIGTIEERKNLLLLAKALSLLPQHTRLVVIGKQTNYAKTVKQYIHQQQLEDRILFVPNVSFADLPAIYQMAAVFVYPSRYEGFGLPVLEALVSGTPVIAATGSCLEEAGGPDSLYVDPDDDAGLAKKINLVLSSEEQRQKMIDKGLEYARKFEDDKLAAQLMQLYKNVLNA